MQKGSNPDSKTPIEDIEEASCPLWFVKVIEKFLLRDFCKQTFEEYHSIFSVVLDKMPQSEMHDVRPSNKN